MEWDFIAAIADVLTSSKAGICRRRAAAPRQMIEVHARRKPGVDGTSTLRDAGRLREAVGARVLAANAVLHEEEPVGVEGALDREQA